MPARSKSTNDLPQAKPDHFLAIFGEDEFSVKASAKNTYQAWCAEVGGFDHEIIDAAAANGSEAAAAIARLLEALQTLPFFGAGKVVWFKDCNFLGDERVASTHIVTEMLESLMGELKAQRWQGVRLILSAGKVDRRKAFAKGLEKLARVEMHAGLSAEDKDWATTAELAAREMFSTAGKRVSPEALALFVASVGPNMRALASEAEKVAVYVGARPSVEPADVDLMVSKNKQAKAFALADALGDRNIPKLLSCLNDELWSMRLDSQKSEIGLLYGLISKVRSMLFLKEMIREGWIKQGEDYNRFSSRLKSVPAESLPADRKFNPLASHPFMLFNSLKHSAKYTLEELVAAMEVLLRCNQDLIFSSMDPSVVLQHALLKIAGEKNTPRQVRPGI